VILRLSSAWPVIKVNTSNQLQQFRLQSRLRPRNQSSMPPCDLPGVATFLPKCVSPVVSRQVRQPAKSFTEKYPAQPCQSINFTWPCRQPNPGKGIRAAAVITVITAEVNPRLLRKRGSLTSEPWSGRYKSCPRSWDFRKASAPMTSLELGGLFKHPTLVYAKIHCRRGRAQMDHHHHQIPSITLSGVSQSLTLTSFVTGLSSHRGLTPTRDPCQRGWRSEIRPQQLSCPVRRPGSVPLPTSRQPIWFGRSTSRYANPT